MGDDAIRALTEAFRDMMADRAADPRPTRVRTVNCRSYKMGEEWNSYKVYFRENVRASFGYTSAQMDELNAACCQWIATKLEPGATLTAYDSLSDRTKANWTDLDQQLTEAFSDEADKQLFLSGTDTFKRGNQTLLEYRNELKRRMEAYQPDLVRVDTEFQRQAVRRFIDGLDDAELKGKLRFHCRRMRETLEEAYVFALDWEASEHATCLQEGAVKPQIAVMRPSTDAGSHHPQRSATATTASTNLATPTTDGSHTTMGMLILNEIKRKYIKKG